MTTAAALPPLLALLAVLVVVLAVLVVRLWREDRQWRARVTRWHREPMRPEGPP